MQTVAHINRSPHKLSHIKSEFHNDIWDAIHMNPVYDRISILWAAAGVLLTRGKPLADTL